MDASASSHNPADRVLVLRLINPDSSPLGRERLFPDGNKRCEPTVLCTPDSGSLELVVKRASRSASH